MKLPSSMIAKSIGCATLFCFQPLPLLAQPDDDNTAPVMEEVIVTGSRIPRRDYTSLSPLTTVSRLELELSGITTLENSINTLPQVIPGSSASLNQGDDSDIATFNLRGLGTNRALTLLNGRRFVPSGPTGAIDLNSIPAVLVERYEVVSGGASAVYGSDALTGAVNFILRDDFEGVEVSSQYNVTDEGDGDILDLNIAGGTSFANGRGYISGFVGRYDRDPVTQDERDFSAVPLDSNFQTGEITPGGSGTIPDGRISNINSIDGVPAPFGVVLDANGEATPFELADLYNFAPFAYLQTDMERNSLASFLQFEITPAVSLYGEYMYVDTQLSKQMAPTGSFLGRGQINTDNPFLGESLREELEANYDPDGDGLAEIDLFKRLVEFGPRREEADTELHRLVLGIRASVFDDWTLDVHLNIADSDRQINKFNNGSESRFRQALLVDPATNTCFDTSGGCQPANIFGAGNLSEGAEAFIRENPIRTDTDIEQTILGASLVGDIVQLPAGPVSLAIGVEARDEDYSEKTRNADTLDALGVFIAPDVDGDIEYREIFGELRIPLLADRSMFEYLGLEGGYRYTDHSLSDEFHTWKVAAEWVPVSSVRFRAAWQEAARAPNAQEYFEAEQTGINPFIGDSDRCSASRNPRESGYTELCVAQGMPEDQLGVFEAEAFFPTRVATGGNEDLDPEKSDTLTLGVVAEPAFIPGLSLALDYFDIEITEAITQLEASAVVITCFIRNDIEFDTCQSLTRDPSSLNIDTVTGDYRNISRLSSKGFDLQLEYSRELPTWMSLPGSSAFLDVSVLATYYDEMVYKVGPGLPAFQCAGFIGAPCAFTSYGTLPDTRTRARLSYSSGPLNVALQWSWIDSQDWAYLEYANELGFDPESVVPITDNISAESYWDLFFNLQLGDSWEVFGGIENLGDEEPPILASNQIDANTDPTTYDVMGRSYFVGIRARFGD